MTDDKAERLVELDRRSAEHDRKHAEAEQRHVEKLDKLERDKLEAELIRGEAELLGSGITGLPPDLPADLGVAVEVSVLRLIDRLRKGLGEGTRFEDPAGIKIPWQANPGTGEVIVGLAIDGLVWAEDSAVDGCPIVAMREASDGWAEQAYLGDDGKLGPWMAEAPPAGRSRLN